ALKSAPALPPEKSQPVRVPRFEAPPAIDGKLDDAAWKQAVVLKDFYQLNPGDHTAPTAPTEVLIGYDSKHLYVAFRAFDDPSKVRATVARRDNVFGEDNVRLFLDTFNDQRRAYVLGFNPLGIQQDGIHTEGVGVDYSVDIVMESKGAITADGYVVEVAVPFKSLRYEAGKGKMWGLHAWRNIDRNSDEMDSWMPIPRNNSGTLNVAGKLTGLEDISTERTLEVIPSLTLSETGRRVRARETSNGRFVNDPLAFDPGVTAKFVASSAMTLDLAVNPDFAQVEADSLVVTTNQRFPIFFAEKRPFFLEGKEIFETALTAVHTRAIVDPDLALKLSGKHGRNTYGVMFATDNGPGNLGREDRNFIRDTRLSEDEDELARRGSLLKLVDRNATVGVLRVKRDLGREDNLGLIATTYNFVDRHSHLGGVDGRFRLDPQTTVQFQLVGTAANTFHFDPFAVGGDLDTRRSGFGYLGQYYRQGRNWGFELWGEGRTRDYRADVGFTPRTNTNFNSLWLAYNSDPNQKARVVRKHFHNFTHIDYDFQGRMQAWESEFNTEWGFQRNSYLGVAYEYAYERLFEEEFGASRDGSCVREGRCAPAFIGAPERSTSKNHYFVYGGFRPSKKYNLSWRAVYRDGHYDFDFGAGRRFPRVSPAALAFGQDAPFDPGPGGLLELRGTFIYQPTNELNISLDYTKNRLTRYDTDRVAFDVNLVSTRATYQFTRFLFARARVDYETLPRRARGQFLLGWTPNPGTAFYAGYNDDVTVSGFHRLAGFHDPGLRRYERVFFIKASYLFRKSF
ncbi:MAG: carbohydrate binding family 9 domain-containing protein, partial [Acidobacteriota bacterium]|nr:carbohydrate binding family 9 domain-containing protein [Acidobacteriota bacterium]